LHVLSVVGVLTLAAILGKQVCGLAASPQLNRLVIGFGMNPRGEVGLIFASIGATLMIDGSKVVSPALYTAIVLVVMLTTMMTPPLLKWAIARQAVQKDEVT